MVTTFSELANKVKKFDFSTLSYYKGLNAIFYRTETNEFQTWEPETNVEEAERWSDAVFVGYLTEKSAMEGGKPNIREEKERIQLKFGELV